MEDVDELEAMETVEKEYSIEYADLSLPEFGEKVDFTNLKDDEEGKDEWRDAMILQTEEIDTIYRFRGKDIHAFTDDFVF